MNRRVLIAASTALIAAGCSAGSGTGRLTPTPGPPAWLRCMPKGSHPVDGYTGLPLKRAVARAVSLGYVVDRVDDARDCVEGALVLTDKPVIAFATDQGGTITTAYAGPPR